MPKCACSELQQERGKFQPVLPSILKKGRSGYGEKNFSQYLRIAGGIFCKRQ